MNEEYENALPLMRYAVHQKLNFDDYKSSTVREYTNCFAHAIGSTITACPSLYRLGMISEKKKVDEAYFSENEVKDLFLSDLKILELQVKELSFVNKNIFLESIKDIELQKNEHIVVLFVKKYADDKIHDFHFIRFDNEYGWTEKYFRRYVTFIEDINISWPSFWMFPIGAFKITR